VFALFAVVFLGCAFLARRLSRYARQTL